MRKGSMLLALLSQNSSRVFFWALLFFGVHSHLNEQLREGFRLETDL